MQDKYGRKIEYLRISITQKCNLKCIYCRPEEEKQQANSAGAITPAEYGQIVKIMAAAGIKKVRITGGEPLIRPDLCDIIHNIAKVEGIEDISLTTNGVLLASMAEELKKVGLKRVNISLDSLQDQGFAHITGGHGLDKVLKGVEKSLQVGLGLVKINTVLVRGINDQEIDSFIELTRDRDIDVRFIELMPIGSFGERNADKIIYNNDIIRTHPELIKTEDMDESQPAVYYRVDGYKGRVGFISPMGHRFCRTCNRIRLTYDGKIKLCLGDNAEVDILGVLRESPEKLEGFIRDSIYRKPAGHNFSQNFNSERTMNAIGG